MIECLLNVYGFCLLIAAMIHLMSAVINDEKPSMKTRWLWAFLTVFWPVGIAYFVCKYLFWE